jgi:hypothetical protein
MICSLKKIFACSTENSTQGSRESEESGKTTDPRAL